MFVDQAVEGLEVAIFLVVHVLHQLAEVRSLAEDEGALGGVDLDGGKFTSLIHSKLFNVSVIVQLL